MKEGPDGHEIKRKILVVDDEEMVRRVCGEMLLRIGYEVILASDGVEALEVLAEHGDDISCVLLNVKMPRMDGKETFRELQRMKSEVPVLVSSGYREEDALRGFRDDAIAGFIQKPYSMSEIREKLREILGG